MIRKFHRIGIGFNGAFDMVMRKKNAVFSRQTMSESEQRCPCSAAAGCSREKGFV